MEIESDDKLGIPFPCQISCHSAFLAQIDAERDTIVPAEHR